jgi:hypothetical protein
MRWLALLVVSGCTCVDAPNGIFPCSSDDECVGGFHCIAGRCSNGSSDAGVCPTGMGGLADCSNLGCAGQPCEFTSISRGICCGTTCVDPGNDDNNCGGCGNTCPGSFCAVASSATVVSGYCACSTTCPGTKTCELGGCVCRSDADCLTGQKCSMLPAVGGVCWYPPP